MEELEKTSRPDETKSKLIKALEGKQVNSISLDNGLEFSLFHELEKK